MSLITFQIGQCGNQLGEAFYDFLFNEALEASPAHQAVTAETFFYGTERAHSSGGGGEAADAQALTAKSILVDMEPKVVNKCLQRRSGSAAPWRYSPDLAFFKQEGSGNNWAYGYNAHGSACKDDILDRLRVLLETVDYCQGVLFLSSLAGGTGSGLGSCMIETVADAYPELYRFNMCVVPHLSGEVILQSYNCVLTIAALYEHSDGIMLIENDVVHEICNRLLNLKRPTLHEMNAVIAHQLAAFFFPALDARSPSSGVYSALHNGIDYFASARTSVLHDARYKLVRLLNVPQMPDASKNFSADSWSALEKRLVQLAISHCSEAQINWSVRPRAAGALRQVGNLFIARGSESAKFDFPEVRAFAPDAPVVRDAHTFNKNDRSLSVLSNSQFCVPALSAIVERTHQMCQQNAYLYQYEKFGLSRERFRESLAVCE